MEGPQCLDNKDLELKDKLNNKDLELKDKDLELKVEEMAIQRLESEKQELVRQVLSAEGLLTARCILERVAQLAHEEPRTAGHVKSNQSNCTLALQATLSLEVHGRPWHGPDVRMISSLTGEGKWSLENLLNCWVSR